MIGLEELLLAAAALETVLRTRGWQFCFIGGVAVQRWEIPRFTQDIDLVDKLERMIAKVERRLKMQP